MTTFKNLFFCLSIITYSANAVQTEFNSYRGIQITPESLPSLVATPQYLQAAFNNWLLNTTNTNGVKAVDLIAQLNRKTTLKNLRTTEEENNALLESFGLSNKAKWTYVFSLPEIPDYLIKISGPRLKYHNLLAENNVYHWAYQKPESEEELALRIEKQEEISRQNIPTFQHISRMATWLKLKEKNYYSIKFPDEMYLLHIPGQPTTVCDENYIVLERKAGDFQNIRDTFSEEQLDWYVQENTIEESVDAIINASLWDLHSNVSIIPMQDESTPKFLFFTDLEQPDNSKPSDFYHINSQKRENDVLCGLSEFTKLMSKSETHITKTINAITSHEKFKQFANYQPALVRLNQEASTALQALQKGKKQE